MIFRLLLAMLLSLTLCAGLAIAQPAPASQPTTAPALLPPPPPPAVVVAEPPLAADAHEADKVRELSRGPLVTGGSRRREGAVSARGRFSLAMGAMIQVQAAFYVGDQASMAEKDPADTEGFRVRRARFGLAGELLS